MIIVIYIRQDQPDETDEIEQYVDDEDEHDELFVNIAQLLVVLHV